MPTQSRDELLCPKCNAPLPESAARATSVCRFCGVVSMPSAPKVVERVVERVVVVSSSGAPVASAPMGCPRCAQPLFDGHADDVVLSGCGTCGGIWLGIEASMRIADGASPPEVKALSERASSHARANPNRRPAGMPCPMCRAPLARVRAPRGAVELDVCAEHGTWFDRDELTGVMYAMRTAAPARTGHLPTEEELLCAAATPPTQAERAVFEVPVSSSSSENALEQTANRTAVGVTLGLLGAVLSLAAGGSRS